MAADDGNTRSVGEVVRRGEGVAVVTAMKMEHVVTSPADGVVVEKTGGVITTKAAIEPVWYLPEVAKRFRCDETQLRRCLYEQTGGMFPELVTRPDIQLFLQGPPKSPRAQLGQFASRTRRCRKEALALAEDLGFGEFIRQA